MQTDHSHKHAKLEIVGGYSLLFTLQGTSSAPPLMLMAHQDVVAASTALDKWTYPPFAGHFDGVSIPDLSSVSAQCLSNRRNGSGVVAQATASPT